MFPDSLFLASKLFRGHLAILSLAALMLLAACTTAPRQNEVKETPQPQTTPTALPEKTTAPSSPQPTSEAPAVPDPENFQVNLKKAITIQDYDQMQTFMNDPMQIGAWGTEWRQLRPEELIDQMRSGSVPSSTAVQFLDLSLVELTQKIGQPPETLLAPNTQIDGILYSSGWGESGQDEAILFITEDAGQPLWSAFLYSSGGFDNRLSGSLPAAVGLTYQIVGDGVYQQGLAGQRQQLLDTQMAALPNLQIAPDGRHAATIDGEGRLWLINTFSSSLEQLAGEYDLAPYLLWGDKDTLFLGIWLNDNEKDGPNNGHIATLDINSGTIQILDEQSLSGHRPALLSDYDLVAFDVFDPKNTARTYHPDSGTQVFDPALFASTGEMLQGPLFNPGWATAGNRIAWLVAGSERIAVQLFDLENKTTRQIFNWDPRRFGALVPSPVWSPDGQWLALEVWANDPENSGIWLLAADGSSQLQLDPSGQEPLWVNSSQLVFNTHDQPLLYDLNEQKLFRLDLPENSRIVTFTSAENLAAAAPDEGFTPTPPPTPDPAALPLAGEEISTSPDGRWQAAASWTEPVQIGDQEQYYALLTITDGDRVWSPIAEWRHYGLGFTWPRIVRWSADSGSLYYTNDVSPDGCAVFANGTDLYQLTLDNGEVTELLPGGKTSNLALADDESAMAYTSYQEGQYYLIIESFSGSAEIRIPLIADGESAQPGNILWSPDGNSLILLLVYDACSPNSENSIIQVEPDSKALNTLVDRDDRLFLIESWIHGQGNQIRLRDRNEQFWHLDVISGELTPEG